MIRRIVPIEVSDEEFAYSNIKTILLMPTFEGTVFVVFDAKSEWNYTTELTAEDIFSRLAGQNRV